MIGGAACEKALWPGSARAAEYTVGLADLNFIVPDPASAEWLAMYRYWAGMNEEE